MISLQNIEEYDIIILCKIWWIIVLLSPEKYRECGIVIPQENMEEHDIVIPC